MYWCGRFGYPLWFRHREAHTLQSGNNISTHHLSFQFSFWKMYMTLKIFLNFNCVFHDTRINSPEMFTYISSNLIVLRNLLQDYISLIANSLFLYLATLTQLYLFLCYKMNVTNYKIKRNFVLKVRLY